MEKEKLVALVEGVKRGDEAAMTEMYEAFFDDIYYYILKTVNNDSELASDLTQDTFIEILQSIGSLQEPAAFVTWSRRIAFYRCTAYFKKRHDILVDEDEDGYSVFDTATEDNSEFIPDEALDRDELKKTIHGIINELPEEQRSAVMMRYFEELSVADIAEIQGVSEGTVKSRLNYGRKAIKEAVESYEKKYDIKLHSMGIIPILLWMLRGQRISSGLSITTGLPAAKGAAAAISASAVSTAAATTATTAATVTATSSATAATVIATTTSATATAVTTAATVATKAAGISLFAKIAAGVIAASVVAGGVAIAIPKDDDQAYVENEDDDHEEDGEDDNRDEGGLNEDKPGDEKPDADIDDGRNDGVVTPDSDSYDDDGENVSTQSFKARIDGNVRTVSVTRSGDIVTCLVLSEEVPVDPETAAMLAYLNEDLILEMIIGMMANGDELGALLDPDVFSIGEITDDGAVISMTFDGLDEEKTREAFADFEESNELFGINTVGLEDHALFYNDVEDDLLDCGYVHASMFDESEGGSESGDMEDIEPDSPQFESDRLTCSANWSGTKIDKVHYGERGLFVEANGGLYYYSDESMSNNYLDEDGIKEWGCSEYVGFYYVNEDGYYFVNNNLAHSIKGEIIYAFVDMLSSDLMVYSLGDSHIYRSRFEPTGKMVEDNTVVKFDIKDGRNVVSSTDTVYEGKILPGKGSYSAYPDMMVCLGDEYYIFSFSIEFKGSVTLRVEDALSADEANHFLDYHNYQVTYYKDGADDQLFYMYNGDEYAINLPDGHTVDEIEYFCRSGEALLVFNNGDVYKWQIHTSILGDDPVKDELLTELYDDIEEIFLSKTGYMLLMSDGNFYDLY